LDRKQNPGATDSNTYNWETDSLRKGRVSGTKLAITAPEFFFGKQRLSIPLVHPVIHIS
jgi:hypothetical protein